MQTADLSEMKTQMNMFCFRHEVPVTSQKIQITHMDDDMVVVNKPASIPVSEELVNRLTGC